MVRGRIGVAAASVAVIAGGLLAALGATAAGASSSACGTPGKCYLTTVAPQSVLAGESQAFTFTVTNEATTQTLGSVQVTAPAGFLVTNASAPVGGASYTANSALFLNLGLNPTQSATLTVYASAPCSGASGWSVEAKQSNQFNGPNNGFVLDSNSSLGATVSGSCSLAFLNEPSGGVAGSPITSQVGQPAATNPVSVEVLGSDNKVVTSSNAVISLTIGANPNSPTPVTLSGTTQVQASQGVASFSNVIISQTGWPYTLVATSPGITQQPSATSSYFGIYGSWQSCSGGPCSGSAATKTTTGTVTTSSALSGQFVGVGLGGLAGFSCSGSYQPASDPLNFDVLNPSGATSSALFTVTLEVSKQVVQSSGHPGASSWQVCFASNVQFPAQPGTSLQPVIGGVQYYTGLLLDCTNNTPANTPCVLSRNKDNAGNVLVTFLGYGDMNGRI